MIAEVMVWFREADYGATRAMMADGGALPESFAAWQAEALQAERALVASGLSVLRAVILPNRFESWCRKRGLSHDAQSRRAWAEHQRKRLSRREP